MSAKTASARPRPMMMRAMQESADLAEPSFAPGKTSLQMNVVGKVRFK